MASPSTYRECDGGGAAIVERGVAGEQDRDDKQPAAAQAMKQDARYPTPEFMRLLVELGKIVEREDSLGGKPDGTVRTSVPPKD